MLTIETVLSGFRDMQMMEIVRHFGRWKFQVTDDVKCVVLLGLAVQVKVAPTASAATRPVADQIWFVSVNSKFPLAGGDSVKDTMTH